MRAPGISMRPIVAIVDDDTNVLHAMGRLLHEWGYRPLLFDNGESALRGLDAIRVEAVIVDQEMPMLSGVQVAAVLRQKWDGEGPPLLLVSGNPGKVAEQDRYLFDGIYTKPFAPAELALALATSIRARSDGLARCAASSK